MGWEYNEVFLCPPEGSAPTDVGSVLGGLNALGAGGWELIDRRSTTRTINGKCFAGWLCLMKRSVVPAPLGRAPNVDVAEKEIRKPESVRKKAEAEAKPATGG